MSYENLQQNFASATGLIIDRTSDSLRVLGQASIVSKSRAVTCASAVFNYVEAPWALAISFPHPDLLLGVKGIALHPDFDKKEARTNYLAQAGTLGDSIPPQLNDFATLIMDAELYEFTDEKVYELKRALTLPFSNENVVVSGAIKTPEFIDVVRNAVQSNRDGLLTFFDELNVPVARIQITRGQIQKVYFNGIAGETAFVELLFRQPGRGFAFQSPSNFDWGTVKDLTMPTQQLAAEATRRVNELPMFLNKLGGLGARYHKSVESIPLSNPDENVRWLVERLWASLDGYITIDKLATRLGTDTYTVTQGMRELINRGVVSLLNRSSPFSCNGKLGVPLTSHADFDIHPGDQLIGFYLDPLSGAPIWHQGNFSGVSSVIQPKNLLHTIPVDYRARGALILKNYKLIGVHSGAVRPKTGAGHISVPTYQMMWIGALMDMGTRKLRTAGESDSEEAAMAGLRSRTESVAPERPEKLEKYICASCYTTNTKLGPCFNCGAEIQPPEPEPEPTTKWEKHPLGKKLRELQKRYNITDRQAIIGACVILGLSLFAMATCVGSSNQLPKKKAPVVVAHPSSDVAVKLAVNALGLKGLAPPEYWYEDTSQLTHPSLSFGLYSETNNQKVIFVIFDNLAPLQNLAAFEKQPLFTQAITTEDAPVKIEEGDQIVGYGKMKWYVAHYPIPGPGRKKVVILIGALPAKENGKSVMVVGQAYKPDIPYDYKSTLWLIDQMAEETTKEENEKRLAHATGNPDEQEEPNPEGTTSESTKSESTKSESTASGTQEKGEGKPASFATDEDINSFCEALTTKLQDKLSLPSEAKELIKKEEFKKLKTVVNLGIDDHGDLKNIEITKPAEMESVTNALIKDIKANAPFVGAPKTKSDLLTLQVSLHKGKIHIEVP